MQRIFRFFFLLALFFNSASYADPNDAEETVCGPLKEPFVFWMWRHSAGEASAEPVKNLENSEEISFTTQDGHRLHGYKLRSNLADGVVLGRLLVAQGNAMLANQLLWSLKSLSDSGVEVYIFDYRGYGNSEGKSRLKAITKDYAELYESLLAHKLGKHLLYGISFGGIVLANVIGTGVRFDRAVIDSAPSRISTYGCDESFDPSRGIPENATGIMVVAGELDHIVKPETSEELRDLVAKRGGKSVISPEWSHPFMDASIELHNARMALIKEHLLGESQAQQLITSPVTADPNANP